MIRVAVAGCAGRMGSAVVNAVNTASDLELACGIDPQAASGAGVAASAGAGTATGSSAAASAGTTAASSFPIYTSIARAISAGDIDVLVDFTRPDVVEANLREALSAGIDCVVGTTGLSAEKLEELASLAQGNTTLFYAPNFTTGAVLMMQFARAAAPFFPEAEVIEFHHTKKRDAPSGTAVRTAQIISDARSNKPSKAPGKETEIEGAEGARGALVEGVPVHSVRSSGFVASQEVIFGSMGQSLTIKHDSWDRESYMPGVLLGIRSVGECSGLIVGLENFMK